MHVAELVARAGSDRVGAATDSASIGYLIGSALPDIATMGRFRLKDRPSSEEVRAGVDLHHRTDDAFHSHRWFRRNSQIVAGELEKAGLARGAAMACGHVGVELLLDGQLLDRNPDLRPQVQGAIAAVGHTEHGLATVVGPDRQAEWLVHLGRIADWSLPEDYREPVAVAERLRRILERRPRLAFPFEQVHAVAEVLGRRQSALEAGSGQLIDDLRADVAGRHT
jgi:hypothetical protein